MLLRTASSRLKSHITGIARCCNAIREDLKCLEELIRVGAETRWPYLNARWWSSGSAGSSYIRPAVTVQVTAHCFLTTNSVCTIMFLSYYILGLRHRFWISTLPHPSWLTMQRVFSRT